MSDRREWCRERRLGSLTRVRFGPWCLSVLLDFGRKTLFCER